MEDTNEKAPERHFKGIWIPAVIWLDKRLSMTEKILWAEIDSLDGKDGCFASNDYLANLLDLSEVRISALIGNLKKYGYIQQIAFNGRVRILKSAFPEEVSLIETNNPDPLKPNSPTTCFQEPIYKEDIKEEKKEEVCLRPVDPKIQNSDSEILDTGVESVSAVQTTPKHSPIKLSSVEPKDVPRKQKKLAVGPETLEILKAYRRLMPTITAKNKKFQELLPKAIEVFEEYFHNEGARKLAEALNKYADQPWVQNKIRETKFGLVVPVRLLSRTCIENSLLTLVLNPPQDGRGNISNAPISEEESRQIEADNARRAKEFFEKRDRVAGRAV